MKKIEFEKLILKGSAKLTYVGPDNSLGEDLTTRDVVFFQNVDITDRKLRFREKSIVEYQARYELKHLQNRGHPDQYTRWLAEWFTPVPESEICSALFLLPDDSD